MVFSTLLAAEGLAQLGCGLGAGIATIGAGLGIGKIGGSAMDAIARQWVLVRLVVAPWMLSHVSQRQPARSRQT